MIQTRRDFLSTITAGSSLLSGLRRPFEDGTADVTLRIGSVRLEVAKNHFVDTIGYNGAVPGPLIRLHEGVPVNVELINDTDSNEFVHWHGLMIPPEVDGAEEEQSLFVPAHGRLRYRLTPTPAGTRWVHSHAMAMSDLNRGTYTGQFGFVYIEPKQSPDRFDQEVFLATHEFEPKLGSEEMEDEDLDADQKAKMAAQKKRETKPNGWEIEYKRFTINGKCLGFGEPVRVKEGTRVLFHFLNASATENIKLALPGHAFQVIALDGNPVPNPQMVDVLELGTAERIDAIVDMKSPGVWILGTPKDDDRRDGIGIVVEYANQKGQAKWVAPPKHKWDYTIFGQKERRAYPQPDETIPLVFGKINGGKGGFNRWTVNGKSYDEKAAPRVLNKNKRYRLVFENQTDDAHPVHLHRNSFELYSVNGKQTFGPMKDVVLLKGFKKIEADFTAAREGLTLFHCHQQLHMDYGFKLLFNVV